LHLSIYKSFIALSFSLLPLSACIVDVSQRLAIESVRIFL